MKESSVDTAIQLFSARRKASLLADHNLIMGLYGRQLLTPEQFQRIFDSIRSDKDVQKFNKTRKLLSAINACINSIRASFTETMDAYYIHGLLSSQQFNYLKTEQLLTLMLDEIDDKKTLAKVKRILKKSNDFFSGAIMELNNGKISINIADLKKKSKAPDETPLGVRIQDQKNTLTLLLETLKTKIEVCNNFLKENNIQLKIYNKWIRDLEKTIKSKQNSEWEDILIDRESYERAYTDLFGHLNYGK